jgi:meiotically up-regulated gene 157 (Mug157) protein
VVQSLRQFAATFRSELDDDAFANEFATLADEVQSALEEHAIVEHLEFGKIYAYEVDGFDNGAHWDDANVPSLMSLAYLGVHEKDDPLYLRTRKFLLSDNNPYYFRGKAAEGQASPHSGHERIWPMEIIRRAITSTSDEETAECLQMIRVTHAGMGFMHEAFKKDDPTDYTRD